MGLPQYCLDCFVAEAEARQFANIQERCFLEFYVRLDGRAGALLPELEPPGSKFCLSGKIMVFNCKLKSRENN